MHRNCEEVGFTGTGKDEGQGWGGGAGQFLKGGVALDIVGNQHASGAQSGPDGEEFRPHVFEGVLAVVQKEVDLAERRYEWSEQASGAAAMQGPAVEKFWRNEAADKGVAVFSEGRKVDAVHVAALVVLQCAQDMGGGHAVAHASFNE